MYNFNYEYMTFLYVVHVYMYCNVILYCIALTARDLFAIKIIIIIIIIMLLYLAVPTCNFQCHVMKVISVSRDEGYFSVT